MRIITEPKYDFKDVLIIPKRSTLSSRKEVSLQRQFTFRNSKNVFSGIPIIVANMDSVGTISMANALNRMDMSVALHKHYDVDTLINFFNNNDSSSKNFYSMGILEKDVVKFKAVFEKANIINVCIDVANGYTEKFVNFVKWFRDSYPKITIMAGNVVTGEMTEQLILAGADIVKCGIGQGSVCTTRKIAGVGCPQLSAIIESADACHGLGGHICGDGGLTIPGDFGKGFGAGADFLMAGGIFAGHDECEGEFVYDNFITTTLSTNPDIARNRGEQYYFNKADNQVYTQGNGGWVKYITKPTHMKFYGMSSAAAMNKHAGGVAEYRASEGKEVLIPYKGPIENTANEILGGIRSTCTYVGAKSLKELSKRTTFVLVGQTHNTIFGE